MRESLNDSRISYPHLAFQVLLFLLNLFGVMFCSQEPLFWNGQSLEIVLHCLAVVTSIIIKTADATVD